MYIRKIVLHKFKRFSVNEIETFVMEPTNVINIMAWRNGCGKSSVLAQLNPLPADLKKDFHPGGYKEVFIEHNKDEYVVSSGKLGANKHSFIKNGKELNDGGTLTVQKQLAEEHFRITTDIVDIMLSKTEFTDMSPAVRKQWFNYISPTDMEYGISFYNKIKNNLNEKKISLKILNTNLSKCLETLNENIKTDLPTLEEVNQIKEELFKFKSLGYHYLKTQGHKKDVSERIINLINIYEKIEDRINTSLKDNNIYLETIEDTKYIADLKVEYEKLTKLIKEDSEVIMKLRDTPDNSFKDDLLKRLNEYNQILINNQLQVCSIDSNIELIHTEVQKYEKELEYLRQLNQHIENNYSYYTRDLDGYKEEDITEHNMNTIREKIHSLELERKTLHIEIDRIQVAILECQNVDKHKATCPNCNHDFILDSTQKMDVLIKQKNNITNQINKLKEEVDSYSKKLLAIKSLYEYRSRLLKYVNIYVSKFTTDETKDLSDGEILTYLNTIPSKLEQLKDLSNVYSMLARILTDLKKILNIENTAKSGTPVAEIELRLSRNTIQLNTIKAKLQVIENIKNLLDKKEQVRQQLKSLSSLYNKLDMKEVVEARVHIADEALAELNNIWREAEVHITNKVVTESRIKTITQTIEENKFEIEDYTILERIMSPKSGLVGKSINSFINVFIEDINTIIERVWSYDLKIQPIILEDEDELNYKFKVVINNSFEVEDISKLSSSMKEIVNLAFKISFMKYTRLDSYPLILDELGRTMDAEHREKIFDVIDEYLCNMYNQIFLVCHFETMYARFRPDSFIELKETFIE